MAGEYTKYDLLHRLGNLKCCFVDKAYQWAINNSYGKPSKKEECEMKSLGAQIEIIECMVPENCNCYAEWIEDGSIIWAPDTSYDPQEVIKVDNLRIANSNEDEYLYFRWSGSDALVAGELISGDECVVTELLSNGTTVNHNFPCYQSINMEGWSVCGHVKEAWQARGSLFWNNNYTYHYGDIVKFNGGGIGANQEGVGGYYICASNPTSMLANSQGFHESGHWVRLLCFTKYNEIITYN
jgi:hypothetical protein